MENLENAHPPESEENNEDSNLWLTNAFMRQLRRSARIGIPLMIVCTVLWLSAAVLPLLLLVVKWSQTPSGEFYLMDGENRPRTIYIATTGVIIYCFVRAVNHGRKAWNLLKISDTDDEALLEGSSQLAGMFRWLTIWGAAYVASMLIEEWIRQTH